MGASDDRMADSRCLSAAVAAKDNVLGQDGLQRREGRRSPRPRRRSMPAARAGGARPRTAGAPPAPGAARGRRAGGRSPASGRGYRRSRRSRSRRRRAGGARPAAPATGARAQPETLPRATRPSRRAGPDHPRRLRRAARAASRRRTARVGRAPTAGDRSRAEWRWWPRRPAECRSSARPRVPDERGGASPGRRPPPRQRSRASGTRSRRRGAGVPRGRHRSRSRGVLAHVSRHDACRGVQPSTRLARSFVAPRVSVEIVTIASPATRRASQRGIRRGGGAPSAAAMAGSHSRIGAGSSSTIW